MSTKIYLQLRVINIAIHRAKTYNNIVISCYINLIPILKDKHHKECRIPTDDSCFFRGLIR